MAIDWMYKDSVRLGIVATTTSKTVGDTDIVKEYYWSNYPIILPNLQNSDVETYDPIIKGFPTIASSLTGDASSGTLVLQNHTIYTDIGWKVGYLDHLIHTALEGQAIKLYLVDVDYIREDDFEAADIFDTSNEYCILMYTGIIDSVTGSDDKINISIKNYLAMLDNNIRYLEEDFVSSADADGDYLGNQPKPLCYGQCGNIKLLLVDPVYNDTTNNLAGALYIADSDNVLLFSNVRESGNPLECNTSNASYVILTNHSGVYGEEEVTSAQLATNLGISDLQYTGEIVLVNGDPLAGHGVITADVTGKVPAAEQSAYGVTRARTIPVICLSILMRAFRVNLLSDLEEWVDISSFYVLEEYLEYLASENGLTQWGAFNAGVYIEGTSTAKAAITELLVGIRSYIFINRYNKISVARFNMYDGVLASTTETPDIIWNVGSGDIIQSSTQITKTEIPANKITVSYNKNNTVQEEDTLAAVLDEDVKARYATEYFTYVKNRDSIAGTPIYVNATDILVITSLIYREGARFECEERQHIRDVKRVTRTVKCINADPTIRVGDGVRVNYNHPTFPNGARFDGTIISRNYDLETRITTLEVFS